MRPQRIPRRLLADARRIAARPSDSRIAPPRVRRPASPIRRRSSRVPHELEQVSGEVRARRRGNRRSWAPRKTTRCPVANPWSSPRMASAILISWATAARSAVSAVDHRVEHPHGVDAEHRPAAGARLDLRHAEALQAGRRRVDVAGGDQVGHEVARDHVRRVRRRSSRCRAGWPAGGRRGSARRSAAAARPCTRTSSRAPSASIRARACMTSCAPLEAASPPTVRIMTWSSATPRASRIAFTLRHRAAADRTHPCRMPTGSTSMRSSAIPSRT